MTSTDHQIVEHIGAQTPPFGAKIIRNAKGDVQFEVSAHANTMAEAISAVREAAAELDLTYPRMG